MNYALVHDTLIKRSLVRCVDGVFHERHHIVPRCLGGSDDAGNLTMVTPKEHRLLHKLLCKIHPGNTRLWFAANMMYAGRQGVSPDWLRKKVSDARKLAWSRWDDREQLVAAIKLSWTELRRKARSEDRKKYWAEAENRKANSEKLKAYWKENKVISEETLVQLRVLRQQGLGWRKLSDQTGYAATTLRRYLSA